MSQVGRQLRVKVLARRKSNAFYNIIPNFQEWLIIKCAINVVKGVLQGSTFYEEKDY
jgi:hypothetical protein